MNREDNILCGERLVVHQEEINFTGWMAVREAHYIISQFLRLLTRKALWPLGIKWRVFLFEP